MMENGGKKRQQKEKNNIKKTGKKGRRLSLNTISWIVAIIIFCIIAFIGKDFDWSSVLNTADADFNNVTVEIDLFGKGEVENTTPKEQINVDGAKENLKVYFIDVGQADSILVIDDDKTMLIDAGTNDQGKNVVDFVKNKGVNKIDYLIGTHPHEDHIGGLDDVIRAFDIGTIYMPKVQTNTKTFEDVLDAIEEKNLTITTPMIDDKFSLKNSECQIMTTINDKNDLNNSSITIRMLYGEQSFLFMGDAEKKSEEYRKWPQTTVLKVGHHGSDTSTTKQFLTQIQPKIAVISCGKNNTYGHPTKITLDKLTNAGASIYRTDEVGTILITSNGKTNKVETNIK